VRRFAATGHIGCKERVIATLIGCDRSWPEEATMFSWNTKKLSVEIDVAAIIRALAILAFTLS